MDRHLLGNFRLTRNPNSGDLLLLVEGPILYKTIFNRAFPQLFFSRAFEDRHGQFSWGTYIKRAEKQHDQELKEFCELLRENWYLEDDLDEAFALGLHTEISPTGGFQRTLLGQLVYDAKPYDREKHPGNRDKAEKLAEIMANLIQRHPTYRRGELLVSVPQSNMDKAFDLPAYLCQEVSRRTNIPVTPGVLRKNRETRPMKNFRTVQEKINNVEGVFQADEQEVRGKRILLVDDIYQTGFSINEVGTALRQGGASLVLGLVATKTTQDLTEDQPW
jgi:hypothetical protein